MLKKNLLRKGFPKKKGGGWGFGGLDNKSFFYCFLKTNEHYDVDKNIREKKLRIQL